MDRFTLSLQPTIDQTRLATEAAVNLAKAYYIFITGKLCPENSQFVHAIELTVGEACANSIQHRPDHRKGNIILNFELDRSCITIRIRDRNPYLDFATIKDPDLELGQEAGYGLYIMKNALDEVEYERVDGWNILTLKRTIRMEEMV